MAVLVPQEEVISEGGGQDMPPGFHVIVLPFVDDIRAPPKAMTENLLGVLNRSCRPGSVVDQQPTKIRPSSWPTSLNDFGARQANTGRKCTLIQVSEDLRLALSISVAIPLRPTPSTRVRGGL